MVKRSVDGETLVGPPGDTRVLRVLQTSSVVTERGEEAVAFGDGGWCVQRPFGRPADEEGRLGMYLDCTSGCAKRDVAIDVSRQFLDNPVHAYAIVFSGEAALFLYAAVLGLTVRLATTDNTDDRPAPTFGDVAMAEVLQGR